VAVPGISREQSRRPKFALTTATAAVLLWALSYGNGLTPQAPQAPPALRTASTTSPATTIAVIGDYGCDTAASTCAAASSSSAAVASLVHSWSPDAIWTVGDNSYQWGCVGSAAFTNATNHNCAYPDPALSGQASGTVGTGSTNTALVASAAGPTPADRWANDWYNNETITVRHNGVSYTGVIANNVEPTPYHLHLKTGFSGGYVPQPGDTFTITPLDDVDADQSPYAPDIAAGRFYSVPGNHDATNMNNLIYGGSTTNPGAYCPHQNDGSNYYSGNQNCGYLFNRPTHYTAGFGSDGHGHDLVDFFALDVRGADPDGFGPGSKQYADYQNDLAGSTAIWKIEAQHEPNWSSGQFGPYANTNTAYTGQNTNWTIDNRIDLFLAGHDHDMEQIYGNNATNTVTGKTFMVMGAGGKSVDPFTKPPCPFQGITGINDCYSASGYPYTVWRGDGSSVYGPGSQRIGALKLTISPTQLKAQYVALDGTVLHSYSLYKSGAAEVKGTITDAATGAPVTGARVSYGDGDVYTGAAGSADGPGVYDFRDGIPAGTTLTVAAPGYQTATISVPSVPDASASLALHPQTGLFADSFETGDVSRWDSHSAPPPAVCGPATTPACTPNVGGHAADFEASSPQAGGVQLTRAFNGTSATVDGRAYFNVRSASTNATLFYFRTAADGAMWHAYLDYITGRIGIRTDAGAAATYPGCNLALPTAFPWPGYHSVEAKAIVAPSGSSTLQIWVDGKPETLSGPDGACNTADDTTTQPAFVGNTNAGKVILGDTATNRSFDYWADDAAVNNGYIGSAWGTLHGQVTDAATGAPIAGASVAVAYTANNWSTPPSATTDAQGDYTIASIIANQDLNVTISAAHYTQQTPTVSMPFDGDVTRDAQMALMPGAVNGTVTDAATGAALGGVTITGPENVSTATDDAGHYSLASDPGQVTFTASLPGYADSTATVDVPYGGGAATQDYALAPDPGTVSGTVSRVDGTTPVSGVTVGIDGGPSATTDSSGNYTLTGVPAETSQTVTATAPGYVADSAFVRLPPGGMLAQNYSLKKILFSEDFETGSLTSWTRNSNLLICTGSLGGCPHLGTYAAEGTASGATPAYAARTLSAPAAEVYYRAYVYIRSQATNNVTLLQLANGSGVPIAHVFINAAHQLGIRNDYALTTSQSGTVMSVGAWHALEFRVRINGAASTTAVYLDGSAIPSLSSTSVNLGPSSVAAVWLGENQAGRSYDLLYDDIVVQDGYVGP
jgi:Carboxypeptidase regulatory-like domain/Calcineurin-like phosphoesterase